MQNIVQHIVNLMPGLAEMHSKRVDITAQQHWDISLFVSLRLFVFVCCRETVY